MATKATLNLRSIIKRIQRAVKETHSRTELKVIGNEAAKIIRRRTRLGYGVSRNFAERHRLRPLSAAYVEYRKSFGSLSSFTTSKRSNLTLTGDMLDELGPTTITNQSVTLGFENTFSKQKAKWVTEGGRPFLFMSRLETKQLVRFTDKKLSEAVKAERL